MHQKQPPAKIAVLVGAGGGSAAWQKFGLITAARARINEEKCFLIWFKSWTQFTCSMASAPATIAARAEIIPANYFAPLDLETIYGNRAPLEVDLGCGDGLFLAAAAAANPSNNFLGIERMPGRVRSATRKIETRRLGERPRPASGKFLRRSAPAPRRFG